MPSANIVARHIVHAFQEAGDPVTNLKLQKLLYYVQGWHLAVHGAPAFPDRIEAWVHGPVQPGVYGEYKRYRWSPIVDEATLQPIDATLQELIANVLDAYGGESAYQLEVRTHHEPPWLAARGDLALDQESNAVITQDAMTAFFGELLRSGGDGSTEG